MGVRQEVWGIGLKSISTGSVPGPHTDLVTVKYWWRPLYRVSRAGSTPSRFYNRNIQVSSYSKSTTTTKVLLVDLQSRNPNNYYHFLVILPPRIFIWFWTLSTWRKIKRSIYPRFWVDGTDDSISERGPGGDNISLLQPELREVPEKRDWKTLWGSTQDLKQNQIFKFTKGTTRRNPTLILPTLNVEERERQGTLRN